MDLADTLSFPDSLRRDLERAVQILKDVGCEQVFVFGSVAEGRFDQDSDIDLAVMGCPPGTFFAVYGKLIMELEHPVDLVDLDMAQPFTEYLRSKGTLQRID